MRLSRATCVLLFLVVVATVCVAQQEFSTSASALLQSAGAPDASNVYGVTVIQEDVSVKVDAAMRMTERYHLVYRIDSPDAVEGVYSAGRGEGGQLARTLDFHCFPFVTEQ